MFRFLFALCLGLASAAHAAPAPVRFILTFDDGPSLWRSAPTARILQQLQDNPVVPQIKAVFFVQTAHPDHGGSVAGQALERQSCAQGHVLGVHSGSPRGHIPHTLMAPEELLQSLQQGIRDIEAQCGTQAGVVRPPDWEFNDSTLATYRQAGLAMLQTDVSANDGKIYGWNISLRRRSHMHDSLAVVLQAWQAGKLPEVAGVTPVIVAFHDVNPYTATHMTEYLQILVEEAKNVGLPLDATPFYTDTAQLRSATLARANGPGYVCEGASRSVTWRERLFGAPALMKKGCLPD
ncbi:polysaccharide deacetylase family protein [Silvimonas sp. JCM 19000]